MEQAQYRMWAAKRKHCWNSHIQASTSPFYNNNSWEEQAFAEDAAGPLGGCIWPPRSYSCSFCRREFRSAQALGGHMNVHRRDRARLKQSPSSYNETLNQNHHNNSIQNSITYPSQVCTLVYNPNPNFADAGIMVSPSSPSRVSAPPTHENCSAEAFILPHASAAVQEHQKRPRTSSPPSWSNLVADKYSYCISDLKTEEDKSSRFLDQSGYRAKGDYVTTDLSVSMNLFICRAHPTVPGGKEEISTVGCKRKRTDQASTLPFFLKPRSVDRQYLHSKELGVSPNSIEDLDLELRLGDPPQVK
ncbi:hypothetical protein I3843_09G193500 [Carya illinoinensis]|uniref:C2H2-type domain-containing protein n=1 Tax=Carya illinoinensis TaxID=32201 RepID=A0A922E602_CARIL|nr:hypothetical protein I3842_09G199300 [Carya illinoinensis]KAG7964875.1 hypothetical protein I3843_09G193500 [Carya illinoinensis]